LRDPPPVYGSWFCDERRSVVSNPLAPPCAHYYIRLYALVALPPRGLDSDSHPPYVSMPAQTELAQRIDQLWAGTWDAAAPTPVQLVARWEAEAAAEAAAAGRDAGQAEEEEEMEADAQGHEQRAADAHATQTSVGDRSPASDPSPPLPPSPMSQQQVTCAAPQPMPAARARGELRRRDGQNNAGAKTH
jgi:hypothetical protein